jgi:HIRAN domain
VRVSALYEERYWYPDDGGIVWLAGYTVTDPDTGDFLARDDPKLAERGLRVMNVAGARFHDEALQSDAAAPGRPLVLRPEPENEHDPNAIAVDTEDGAHLGYVPRELAAEVGPDWSAVSLRESRASPRDPRTGLTMLLAAAPEILLG